MRYYAEWLDGEYLLLNRANRGYAHSAVMQRAIRFHALFGSTLVLSDAQTIDIRTPLTTLFLDRGFRQFLREQPNFLALVADPVRGVQDPGFAISMRGIERLSNQANKPGDSFEEAITQLGEPIFHAGHFDADRYLKPGGNRKGSVGRVIRRFPQYGRELKGLLHLVDYFSRCPLPTTTTPASGIPQRYDTLLKSVENNPKLVDEHKAKRIREILRIQEEHIPDAQQGRRAAIRKVLGTGKWHAEKWSPENRRLYLDVVHAWNCAINLTIAPEAGTLYESRDDIQLSKYNRAVTDTVTWTRARAMPMKRFSNSIQRFLSWDPLTADWKQIAAITRLTRESAEYLQATLKTEDLEARADALKTHASRIAACLVDVPTKEIPEWSWTILQAGATLTDIVPSEIIDVAKEIVHEAPYLRAAVQRKQVVNTVKQTGPELL